MNAPGENLEPCACTMANTVHDADCRWAERERQLWAVAIARVRLRALEWQLEQLRRLVPVPLEGLAAFAATARRSETETPDRGAS